MLLRYMLAVSLLAVNSIAWADSIDVNLSNDVAQFQYLASSGRVGQGVSEFHMGFLYNNSSNAMVDVGLTVSNSDDRSSIATFGIGVKAIAATVGKNTNAVALALGGQIRIAPAADKKFGIVAQGYLAPDIVTFGDADRFVQTGVRLEYEIMPQAAAYVGYRKTKFGLNTVPSTDVVLEEGAHVGVKFAF